MKFWFIKEHRSEFPVSKMSQALGVSATGFYSYLNRKPSKASVFKQELQGMIQSAYDSHGGAAGCRTIAADLKALGMENAGRAK